MCKAAVGLLAAMVLAACVSGCGPSSRLSTGERQASIRDMEARTLEKFYREDPWLRDKVTQSPGYGTFANANVNLVLASAGGGYGVVVDNATGQRTYMRMALGGLGLGLGVKDYRQIVVFKTREAMYRFTTSGWQFGGHADAAAKAGDTGAAVGGERDISSDIDVYSLTETGLALQATLTGTKYWKDDSLN
ncbi:MAG: hypothetical protein IH624_04305 [Phycisphaerae bacterium]|nr:hypothetical protein [Phycisphaerae bacterium]